jgi:hypothetical protein
VAESGFAIYAVYIEAQLKAEYDARTSINTRAASALTGATGLVTLTLAVFAVLVGTQHVFTGCARDWLIVALGLLLLAGAFAVAAAFPWRQELTSTRTIHKMLNARRLDPEDVAIDAVAYCNAVAVQSIRSGTAVKVWLLLAAGIAQILAIAALAAFTWAAVTSQG